MVKDEDAYPEDTVVRIIKTGEIVLIKKRNFLKDGRGFLHYLVEFEGKKGLYCVFHQDVELEALPKK